MALSDAETAAFNRLSSSLGACRRDLDTLDAYYDGIQRMEHLGLAVPPELQRFVTIVNWPRTAADAVERRIDLEGFRLAGSDGTDDDLWRIWQANDLDEESQLAHLDALVFGRSYIAVGTNPDDGSTPLITVESAREVTCERDPVTRRVTAALRKYVERTDAMLTVEHATLYLPDVTVWLTRSPGTPGGWQEADRDPHMLGTVPIVPMVNRPRLARRDGLSEMTDVISLTDAAVRALTNAQVATEVAAIPQRYVLGATPSDFVDPKTGRNLTAWETYFGSVWALLNSDAKVGQFSAADLGNFTRIVDHYANLVAGVTGLPMRYFGQNTANPPSADAIRADESQLVLNVRRKHRSFEGTWEKVMRLTRRLVDGEWDPALNNIETKWASPETPTDAQKADAVQKLSSTMVGGVPILPLRMARERLGWSEGDIKRAEDMDAEAPTDPIAQLNATLERQAAGAPATAGEAVA